MQGLHGHKVKATVQDRLMQAKIYIFFLVPSLASLLSTIKGGR
jgi:hypothetical protein